MSMVRKLVWRSGLVLMALPVLAAAALLATGNGFFLTALSRTYLVGEPTANINDHRRFATRLIDAGPAEPWERHPAHADTRVPQEFATLLAENKAAAFLVVQDGKLVAEHYVSPYHVASRTNSFSVAKTVVTLLLGIAVEEGLIAGLDQPVVDWLPEFADDPLAGTATVGELAAMTSGYDWIEHYYSPFSPTVELYYSSDVTDFLLARGFSDRPGSRFYYSSASTQLLAIVLTRALKARSEGATLAGYLSTRLWQPLGMNDAALWHTDGRAMELGYCCINTNARNFAKLGQLMLNGGRWHDRQLVPAAFIERMVTPVTNPEYGYGTWVSAGQDPAFFAMRGHLGQYVVVVPEYELVVVRLGEERYLPGETMHSALPHYIRAALALAGSGGDDTQP